RSVRGRRGLAQLRLRHRNLLARRHVGRIHPIGAAPMSEPARTIDIDADEIGRLERHLRAIPSLANASAERLQSYVERLEVLAEEKAALSADISEVMAEAKLEGFDPKALRLLLK